MTEQTSDEKRTTAQCLLAASKEIEAETGHTGKRFANDRNKTATFNVDMPSDEEFETIERILTDHGFEIDGKYRIDPRTEPEFMRLRLTDVRGGE